MMIVPLAANMPPTPWQTEILAPGIWAGAMPRIWHTVSCNATKRRGYKIIGDQLPVTGVTVKALRRQPRQLGSIFL